MRWRRHLLALLAAGAAIAAALAVSQPTPVAAATGGSITIEIDTNPADGTDIGFTGCQGSACGPFTLDDDTDPALSDRLTATSLAPGTYTITQAAVPGWTLSSLSCTSGATTSVAERRATIALSAGAAVSCRFAEHAPSITIVQDTNPENAQDLHYTGCLGEGCSTFALDDDADATRPNVLTGSGLAPGTYTITQSPDATWPLSAISCGTGPGITTDVANRRVTLVLAEPTDHRTCTFKNVTQTITIVEDDLTDSGVDHTFTGCSAGGCAPFTLDDDSDPTLPARYVSGPLPLGSYTITQDAVPGWELVGLDCPSETSDLLHRRGSITLHRGEQRTCTFENQPIPPARPPLTRIAQIDAGFFRTCAVLTSGQVRCWGSGYPGDGSQRGTTNPATVSNPEGTGPLTDVVQVATGLGFACATLRDGHAVCWGANTEGQLGNGTTTDAARPTPVLAPDGNGPLTGVAEVSAGFRRACARLTDGQVRCWGYNQDGTLGNATSGGDALRPIVVLDQAGTGPLQDVADVSVGLRHLCAALSTGQARCWGEGSWGQLGQGARVDSLVPVVVTDPSGTAPLADVTAVSGLWDHTCASLGSGEARCWGNDEGLGVSVVPGGSTAVPVTVADTSGATALTAVRFVAVGAFWSCAGVESRTATCWGENPGGSLGDGTTLPHRLPRPVLSDAAGAPLRGVVQLTAGYDHTCAVLDSGEARCWGSNRDGQLGDGTTTARALPVPVTE